MSDRKRDTIVWLLEHLEDAYMERMAGGEKIRDSFAFQAGPLWNGAFRELDRCLNRMRSLARQEAVYENRKGNGHPNGSDAAEAVSARSRGIPLGTARWHVLAWYVQVERRQIVVQQSVKKRNGKRGTVPVDAMQPLRHRDARQVKADAGVAWIVGEFAWESGVVQAGLAEVARLRAKRLPVEAVKAAA